jgi:hypothetical protein
MLHAAHPVSDSPCWLTLQPEAGPGEEEVVLSCSADGWVYQWRRDMEQNCDIYVVQVGCCSCAMVQGLCRVHDGWGARLLLAP